MGLGRWLGPLLKLGVLPCMAAYLVWTLAVEQRNDTRTTREMLAQHTEVTRQAVADRNSWQDAQSAQIGVLIGLMRQLCVNTAATREQQRECVR